MCASLRVGFRIESLATSALALTLQATHNEWVVLQCLRLFEKIVQFCIVVVGGTLEPGADKQIFGLVEHPEISFELQHRLLPLGHHPHRLARTGVVYKYPLKTKASRE